MQTELNETFKSLTIQLDSIEEVRELLGILAKVHNRPPIITELHQRLRKVACVPMAGLYTGKIERVR